MRSLQTMLQSTRMRIRSTQVQYDEFTAVLGALKNLGFKSPRRIRDRRVHLFHLLEILRARLGELEAAATDCGGDKELEAEVLRTLYMKFGSNKARPKSNRKKSKEAISLEARERQLRFQKRMREIWKSSPPRPKKQGDAKMLGEILASWITQSQGLRDELAATEGRRAALVLKREIHTVSQNIKSLWSAIDI